MKKISNYELQCEDWRQRFLKMNVSSLMKKLPELRIEGGDLVVSHYARRCGVDLETGLIRDLDAPEKPLSISERLNIYTLFEYSKPEARLSGSWVPFSELRDASVFTSAFRRGNMEPFAAAFSGRAAALVRGCEKLGGTRLAMSDVGYELKAFDCIPVWFLFWDGDEEFPAQANILFDSSAVDFIHVESTVTIASVGVARIAEEAGCDAGGGFDMI